MGEIANFPLSAKLLDTDLGRRSALLVIKVRPEINAVDMKLMVSTTLLKTSRRIYEVLSEVSKLNMVRKAK